MSTRRDSFNEINITPLTDIFLVLLIIMMVVAPLLDQQGLNLVVPEMVEESQIKESKTITVTVTGDNRYFINEEEVTADNLKDVLKNEQKINKDGLLIQSEADATHGAVVKLMDSARNSGITNISIIEG